MSLASTLHADFGRRWPALGAFVWPRRVLRRLVALDAAYRERDTMRHLDDRILRDIGLTRADVDAVLSQPEAHRRLVLARGGGELQD